MKDAAEISLISHLRVCTVLQMFAQVKNYDTMHVEIYLMEKVCDENSITIYDSAHCEHHSVDYDLQPILILLPSRETSWSFSTQCMID